MPVKDRQLKKYLREVLLEAYLRDNVKARELRPDGGYARAAPPQGAGRFSSQDEALWASDSPPLPQGA